VAGNSLFYLLIKKMIKLTVGTIEGYHCYQLHNKILSNILLSKLTPYAGGYREGLWLRQERSDVKHSHWNWYTYETSYANKNLFQTKRIVKSSYLKIFWTHFVFKMVWNKEMLYHHCFTIYHQKVQEKSGRTGIEWNTSAPGLCWKC